MYYFSKCLAHSPNDYLKDHLRLVAIAAQNMWCGSRNLPPYAAVLAGLLHDIGKANRWFQDRVTGKSHKKSAYSSHSQLSAAIAWYVASAIHLEGEVLNRLRLSVFTTILRHHGNLKESWADELALFKQKLCSTEENGRMVLDAQLGSMDILGIEEWLSNMTKEFDLPLTVPPITSDAIIETINSTRKLRLKNCFYDLDHAVDFIALYSSLLQSDKIHSATGKIERKRYDLPETLVKDFIRECLPRHNCQLVKIRDKIAEEIEQELLTNHGGHFYTVTAPTGSGKTLAILNATLKLKKYLKAAAGASPSIIYCLPFMSIIDQNYNVCREVLEHGGIPINSELLLKHHHLSDPVYISSDPEFDTDNSELFTETWRSEIVVTTFHQLLNGIISHRNRNLKRFISLKDAIVILDEVQTLPHRYWESIKKLFQIAGHNLNTRFILMTATQPLLFTRDMAIELLPKHKEYFQQLSRVTVINRSGNDTPLEDFFHLVLAELKENPKLSRMCVVNRRSTVAKLYGLFRDHVKSHTIYALSANLTPKDRQERIKKISHALNADIPCLVLTTQLIEAGVDLSVEILDRDMAPLDSIIQSAGRCNRHGGKAKGIVNIWSLTDNGEKLWKRVYDQFLINCTQEVINGKPYIEETQFLDLGQKYFHIILSRSEPDEIDRIIRDGRFSDIEDQFKLIDDDGHRESYFIIKSEEDRILWEKYCELKEIKNPLERKTVFGMFKAHFMEQIVQVYVRGGREGIIPVEHSFGSYSDDLGFIGDSGMSGSIIL